MIKHHQIILTTTAVNEAQRRKRQCIHFGQSRDVIFLCDFFSALIVSLNAASITLYSRQQNTMKMMSVRPSVCLSSIFFVLRRITDAKKEQEMSSCQFSPSAPKKKKHTTYKRETQERVPYLNLNTLFSYTACEGSIDPELSLSVCLSTKKQQRGELAGHPRGAAPLGLLNR